MQRRLAAGLAGLVLLGSLAVNRQPNADRSCEHARVALQALSVDVHRFLFAAIGAVAYQAFADDIGGHLDCILSIGKRLQVFGDRQRGGIPRLQIEPAERKQRQKKQDESALRRAPAKEHSSRYRQHERRPAIAEVSARNNLQQ